MLHSNNPKGPVVIVSKDIVYAFPFGIAYVAGYLRQKGEDVRVLFRPENPYFFKSFAEKIIAMKPLVVGFGGLYPDLYPIRELVGIFNELGRDFPIALGGQMISPTPEFAVRITGADYGVIGEGEIIFHNLVTALKNGEDTSQVKGIAIFDGETTQVTEAGEYIKDLSDLPPIPYDLFPVDKWLDIGRYYTQIPQAHWRYNDRVVSIHGGRGCPFTCNFCYHSSKARYRKISEMLVEAEELIQRYDANMVYFGDDLVLANPKRAWELIEALKGLSRKVEYSVSCRFDILNRMDDELLREMKRSGCRIMGLGIESGSQRILDIMHKKITVEQIKTGLRRLKDVGILPTVSIMVGQYTETPEDAEMSLALMLEAVRYDKNIQFAFTITTPFPGSELYEIALKEGKLNDDLDFYERFNPEKQIGELTVNFTTMSDEEVRAYRAKMENLFRSESGRAKGRALHVIESVRRFLGKIDYEGRRKIFAESKPKGALGLLFAPYFVAYDLVQLGLDKLRLKLLGLS